MHPTNSSILNEDLFWNENLVEKVYEKIYIANPGHGIILYMEGKKSVSREYFYSTRYQGATEQTYYKYNDKDKFKESQTEKERKRYKVLNKKAISMLTGSNYYDIKSYISEYAIKTNTIEGLIQVMDYYEKLKSVED